MAAETSFQHSGLKDLSDVLDWNNEHHRRCVVASLVQGVYNLERAHQRSEDPDPSWWKSFGFQLNGPPLCDDKDGSYFGAVYKYDLTSITPNTPRYVIAFRGTLFKQGSWHRDIKLDLKVIRNRLEGDPRFVIANQRIEKIISKSRDSNVWLAGHSLGSVIALLVGKKLMLEMGRPIKTYLFNPPCPSIHIEWIKFKLLKLGIYTVRSVATAGVAVATSKTHQNDSFSILDSWMPYMFVNPSDHICCGYIGYFEQRKKLVEIGVGKIGRLATQHTLRSLLSVSSRRDSEPFHILPSADLTINKSPSSGFNDAHGLQQWWRLDNQYESKSHRFSEL